MAKIINTPKPNKRAMCSNCGGTIQGFHLTKEEIENIIFCPNCGADFTPLDESENDGLSYGRKLVEYRLQMQPECPQRKQVQITIRQDLIDKLNQIANVMTESSGCKVTRNMLIRDAVEAYVIESKELLKDI